MLIAGLMASTALLIGQIVGNAMQSARNRREDAFFVSRVRRSHSRYYA